MYNCKLTHASCPLRLLRCCLKTYGEYKTAKYKLISGFGAILGF
jgi:hypothetical protein